MNQCKYGGKCYYHLTISTLLACCPHILTCISSAHNACNSDQQQQIDNEGNKTKYTYL